MVDLIQHWNASSAKLPKNKSVSRYAIEKEKEFPKNSIIVDLGGGTGADALYFLEHGHKVILMDISDYSLNVAKKKAQELGLKLQVLQSDLNDKKIELASNSVDIVYARLSLHYFDAEATAEIFKEINRILKPGGKATLTVKSPQDISEMDFLRKTATEIESGVFSEEGRIKSRFTKQQLREILKKSGLSNYQVQPYKEDLGGRVDRIKSGNQQQLFTEISFVNDSKTIDPVIETVKTYDQLATEYRDRYLKNSDQNHLKSLLDEFLSILPGKRVLDIGSGAGFDAKYLSDNGCHVVSIDLSKKMLEIARKIAPAVEFREMDMRSMDFEGGSFDGVWASSSLVHIPKEQTGSVISKITKILSPQGIFLIAMKEGIGQTYIENKGEGNLPGARRFFVYYQKKELEKILTNNGFSIVNFSVDSNRGNSWLRFLCKKI